MNTRATKDQVDVYKTISVYNAQPEVLTAILKQRLGLKGHLGDVYIQIFGNDGSYIQFATHPHPAKEEVVVKLPISPPLKDGWGARPLMAQWKREALAKYNVPETPPVRYFKSPPMFPFVLPAGVLIGAWFFCAVGKGQYADLARAWIDRTLGRLTIPITGYFMAAMHLFVEPAYMATQLYKHKTPAAAGIKWILLTVAFGIGAIDNFWECIIYEKIRHIYRQTDVGDIGPNAKEDVSALKKQQ